MVALSAAGLDFIDPGEITLQFDNTAANQTVRLTIIDDAVLESNEYFIGHLGTTDAAVIVAPSQAEATIIEDNDGEFCCGLLSLCCRDAAMESCIMWILLIDSS